MSISEMTSFRGTASALDTATLEQSLFANYVRAPVAFERGEGARLFAVGGKIYIDFLGGIATNCLGHGYPRLVKAIQEQAAKVLHVSNLYQVPEQSRAADLLIKASGGHFQRAFFCNSGAEANEAMIKLARLWGYEQSQGDEADQGVPEPGRESKRKHKIVCTDGAFHGRTLGALAATGTPAYRVGFEPLPEGFDHVPFGDLEAMDRAIDDHTCAVLLEPVQGEGGVFPAEAEYLGTVADLCKQRGALFLLDEVQTGAGRLGTMFGYQHYGVEPDAISLAKGLGGGVPVGAVLAKEKLAALLVPGKHGTTFGGNPLAMAAVSAVQEALVEDGVLAGVQAKSQRLRAGLAQLSRDFSAIRGVRGEGLMLALLLNESIEAKQLGQVCLDLGLLVNAVRPHAIRLLPPLVISEDEIDEGLGILRSALEVVSKASEASEAGP